MIREFDIRVPVVQIARRLEDVVGVRELRAVRTTEGDQIMDQLKASLRALDREDLIPAEDPPLAPVGIADVLSPSQVRSWCDCQARWMFKYLLDLPERGNATLALGSALHAAAAENFRQKTETRKDLPEAAAIALFRDAWSAEAGEVEFRDDEDPAELRSMGEWMTARYIDQIAPLIQPAVVNGLPAVELDASGLIAGVPVRGRIDVMTEDGTICDIKTASKAPSGAPNRFQVATYRQITPGASGKGRIDTITKTKTVRVVSQSFDVSIDDLRQTAALYPLARDAMRAGYYTPNRGSLLCSRKHCSYWRECQREFGGSVE